MKKLFFVMAAVAALLTSCSKDDTFGGPTRGKVTFEVSTPELATRYGEGTTATALQYAVYDMIEDATNGKLVDTGKATLSNKTANVSIDLVEGRKYTAIFWADAGENASPYTFNKEAKTVSYTNVNDLKANQEAYDAFYAFVPQADIKVGQTVNVTLKRPFAQLRIETSDTDRAKQLGVEVVKTGITVNAYTSFNLETGAVDGKQNITFKPTDKASASTTVGEVTYDLISMNYILANPTTADLVDVTLNFTDDVNGTEESYVRKYSSIDVKRNHRTIVRGTILTDPTQFNVTVSEDFTDDINEDRNTSETLVVSTADEIIDAFENLNDDDPSNDPGTIVLGDDIDLGSGDWTSIFGYDNSASLSTMTRAGEEQDPSITIKKNQELTLDLNGFTLSGTSKQTGKNYNMIDVRGTLTIQNGTITTEHKGTNMLWNNSTNVFNVTDGGVLNLSNVTAKNLGGSDMAFVAHLNNWGEVTLNVDNSTLESTYIAVRVFNSGNDMNNVTIKNSTLEGKYSFWVHNYKAAGDEVGTDATLNFDIFNGTNTFEYTGKAPVLYGFDNPIYFDANGNVGTNDAGNKFIYDAAGLAQIATTVNGGESLKGKTITLMADIDLNNEEWTPIGNGTNKFQGIFDGNGHVISNLSINTPSKSDVGLFGFTTDGEVKNLTVNNATVTGRLDVGVVAGTPYTSKYTNIKVTGHVEVNGMAYVGGVGGKNAYANWNNVTVDVDNTSYVKANSVEDGKAYRTYVGGVVGFNGEGGHSFTNITSNIDVEGSTIDVGGMFGIAHYGNKFDNCSSSGDVKITNASDAADAEEIGGIAGVWHNQDGTQVTFTNCLFTGTLSANVDGVDLSDNTIVGSAYSSTGTGKLFINGKEFVPKSESQKALEAAIAAAADGETVTLTEDVVATQTIVIPAGKTIIIDLNGKTISATGADGYAINNDKGGILTIEDSANTGVINGIVYTETGKTIIEGGTYNAIENGAYVLLNSSGELTINKATINGGSSYPVYSYNEGNKLVINDVTVKATFGCVNSYGLGGVVEINGGTFEMTGVQGKTSHIAYFSGVDATINGGTFKKIGDISMSGAGGGGICAIYGANLTIMGGEFAGDYADVYNWGGTNANDRGVAISIKGGTFKFEPAVAEGYEATKNGDVWTVSQK